MTPTATFPITRHFSGSLKTSEASFCEAKTRPQSQTDTLAEETPVALVYNGISHVVVMATPQDLPQLALGFSISEGILQRPSQLYDCEVCETQHGIEIRLEIAAECFAALKERRRSFNGRTGCGLCGIDSLAAVSPCITPVPRQNKITAEHLFTALANFDQHQPLREQTGSLHAAAWVVGDKIQAAFEDVGRHNALDKLIGHLAVQHTDTRQGWVLISSRASYEMVAKTAALGIGCLVAMSSATALAVRLAEQAHITLIGFAKPQKFSVYSHGEFVE